MFTMQLSGMHVGGSTCHLTILFIICLNKCGSGSTSSSLIMPGGLPYLSYKKSISKREEDIKQMTKLMYSFLLFPIGILHQRQSCSKHCPVLNVGTSPSRNSNLSSLLCERLDPSARPNFCW